MDESLGSLEELSENLHCELNKLDIHIDHSALMEYQLAEKNRIVILTITIFVSSKHKSKLNFILQISAQQLTIKQLQESLNASHREVQELRRAAEAEVCLNVGFWLIA